MNSSPQRGTFYRQCKIKNALEEGRDPDQDEAVQLALDLEQYRIDQIKDQESDPEWQKNNLEYDLRNTRWICDKAKASESYAQNIYAALCNQDWQKNDVWPLLKGETYSCSWRYAGGIVADMREDGDYINWYCSGISGSVSDEEFRDMTKESQERYLYMKNNFVGEGVVTEEIKQDFFKLGWIPVEDSDFQNI